MNFIHSREYLSAGDIVVVDCSHQSNVMITDDNNFRNFKSSRSFNYHGGSYDYFPVRIQVPHTGYWNITIDLAGRKANIRYNISFIKH